MQTDEPNDGYNYCFAKIEPDFVEFLPESRRHGRLLIDGDLCVSDDQHYFIRGMLTLVIRERKYSFTWLVWVVLTETTFERIVDSWESDGRESNPPDDGILDTKIPGYSDTAGLPVEIVAGPVGQKPSIRIKPSNHAIYTDQLSGIDEEKAILLEKAAEADWG